MLWSHYCQSGYDCCIVTWNAKISSYTALISVTTYEVLCENGTWDIKWVLLGDMRLSLVWNWTRKWCISFGMALTGGCPAHYSHHTCSAFNVFCWSLGQYIQGEECGLFCGWYVEWVQWCSFGNSNVFWGTDCSWTGLCSNMGTNLIKLRQGVGTEEAFLLYGVLAVVNGHPQMAPTISCPGIIALTLGKVPNYTVIPRLEVWEAQQMLGVRPTPDGNYLKEGDFLLNKSNRYATRLATSRLSKLDTFIFHWSTYIPSMSYSLLAMTFDTKTQQA